MVNSCDGIHEDEVASSDGEYKRVRERQRVKGRKAGSAGGEKSVRGKSAPKGEPEGPIYIVQTLHIETV